MGWGSHKDRGRDKGAPDCPATSYRASRELSRPQSTNPNVRFRKCEIPRQPLLETVMLSYSNEDTMRRCTSSKCEALGFAESIGSSKTTFTGQSGLGMPPPQTLDLNGMPLSFFYQVVRLFKFDPQICSIQLLREWPLKCLWKLRR